MSGFLLDTNVVSELRKKERRKKERRSAKVNEWLRAVPVDQDYISVLVIGELERGAALVRRRDPIAGQALERWIGRLQGFYGGRILPVTLDVAQTWGRLSAIRPLPPEDGLIAATALVHDLTLVTRNIRNVEGLGVSLLNPWE